MARVGRSVSRLVDVQVLRYHDRERKVSRPERSQYAVSGPFPRSLSGVGDGRDEYHGDRDGAARSGERAKCLHPVLTLSREYGAGGGDLAGMVAEKLGYTLFGQQMVHEIARRAQVQAALVETIDERCRDRIERFVADLIDGGGFRTADYLEALAVVVRRIGSAGRAVIVGRGGHLLLEPTATLRVRVISPMQDRVRRVMARDQLPESEALQKVLRVDDERRAFHRQAFGIDIREPTQFDMIINTGRVSLKEAADIVLAAHVKRFTSEDAPTSGVRWAVPQQARMDAHDQAR